MYQTIDDDIEDFDDAAPDTQGGLRWLVLGLATALVIVVGYVILSAPMDVRSDNQAAIEDARASYLAALAEPSPALRKARLSDFLSTHPDHDRAEAVRAQLSVLGAREATDWAGVTDALFDRGLRDIDRLAVLYAYETKWGPNLLGGRSDEITELRARLSVKDVADSTPSRVLEQTQSPIPNSIQAESMAGGPVRVTPPRVAPPPEFRSPEPPVRTTQRETPPRVMKSSPPRYPRSAQRRGISAVVELEMDVDARGRVDDVRILSVDAERYGKEFARAARRAAKRTRFEPRRVDGQALATTGVRKRFRFEP